MDGFQSVLTFYISTIVYTPSLLLPNGFVVKSCLLKCNIRARYTLLWLMWLSTDGYQKIYVNISC